MYKYNYLKKRIELKFFEGLMRKYGDDIIFFQQAGDMIPAGQSTYSTIFLLTGF